MAVAARTRPGDVAVVWLNGREAHIARLGFGSGASVTEVERDIEDGRTYLLRVLGSIGDAERIAILGPGSARLELEREYVAIYRRPERLIDVEPSDRPTDDQLLARLGELAEQPTPSGSAR